MLTTVNDANFSCLGELEICFNKKALKVKMMLTDFKSYSGEKFSCFGISNNIIPYHTN
jgi:hypothetical protein